MHSLRSVIRTALLVVITIIIATSCMHDSDELIPLRVQVHGQSMSKLPFIIAKDQNLYEKYGLDVELSISSPEFEDGKETTLPFPIRALRRLRLTSSPDVDIHVNGHTPTIVREVNSAIVPRQIALASTDCSVRYYVVVRPGIDSLEEIKGQRIGVNSPETTSGFAALLLIERMGWDRQFDVSILLDGRGIENLKQNQVDVIVGGDEVFEGAKLEGFNILEDTRTWGDTLAGNSVLVRPDWLEHGNNREAAKRFLQALIEALSIFHENPELTIDIANNWYGTPSREIAEGRYKRADYVPSMPYPCYQGIRNTIRLHDSHEMRKYNASYFYDDSLLRELETSGFIGSLSR